MKIWNILSDDSLQEVIRKVKHNFQHLLSRVQKLGSRIESVDQRLNSIIEKGSYSVSFYASRSKKVTDSYLFNSGKATNVAPFILPGSGRLFAVTLKTAGKYTWDLHIRVNGATKRKINISSRESGVWELYDEDIQVQKGDQVSFYCEGTDIDQPFVQLMIIT